MRALNEKDCLASSVGDVVEPRGPRARPYSLGSDDCQITRFAVGCVVVRTVKDRQIHLGELAVVRSVPGFVKVNLSIDIVVIEIRKDKGAPTQQWTSSCIRDVGRGNRAVPIMILLDRDG